MRSYWENLMLKIEKQINSFFIHTLVSNKWWFDLNSLQRLCHSSFWGNFNYWLHQKLSKWQLPVQLVMKIFLKWMALPSQCCWISREKICKTFAYFIRVVVDLFLEHLILGELQISGHRALPLGLRVILRHFHCDVVRGSVIQTLMIWYRLLPQHAEGLNEETCLQYVYYNE